MYVLWTRTPLSWSFGLRVPRSRNVNCALQIVLQPSVSLASCYGRGGQFVRVPFDVYGARRPFGRCLDNSRKPHNSLSDHGWLGGDRRGWPVQLAAVFAVHALCAG